MVVHLTSRSVKSVSSRPATDPVWRHLRRCGKVLMVSGLSLGMTAAPTGEPVRGEKSVLWKSQDPGKTQIGVEFPVNTFTTGGQRVPSVAMDVDGDFVVVWQSFHDGSGTGVYGQRFDSAGSMVGTEFQVNTVTTSFQSVPSVAMDADGDFVVVWQSYTQDGDYYGIYGQRYNSAGSVVGTEFQVNTFTTSFQSSPSVAMDADGDFVVVWHSYTQDGDYYGIYGQRYNSAGSMVGTEFPVNTVTSNSQTFPSVAMDADGDFVVVWHSFGQDGAGFGVYGQRFDSAGSMVGAEFQVNTFTTSAQIRPSVAMDADGDFVVVWTSGDLIGPGQDGSERGIFGQRYNNAGSMVGAEFQVNTFTTSRQTLPSVAMDADGDFVVVWQSLDQDGAGYGVYGQHFSVNPKAAPGPAAKILTEVPINNTTAGNQTEPAVALDAAGTVIVAFQSSDGSGDGINAVRAAAPLPVQLTGFDVQLQNDEALFTWQTASETNNAGFELEQATLRAGTHTDWHRIAFIDGAGTTTEAQSYAYQVHHLTPGRHRFRLKQIDFDGAFEYSPAIEVTVEVPDSHVLSAMYPNPFNPTTQFELILAREQHVQVDVYDLQGRQVRTVQAGVLSENVPHVLRFEAGGLPGGVYVIQVVGEGFTESRTVTLVK